MIIIYGKAKTNTNKLCKGWQNNNANRKNSTYKSADICINYNHIKHVADNHYKELLNLGLTAQNFIKAIINLYTRIYKDTQTNAYYLAVYADRYTNAAVIEFCRKF